MAASVMSRKFFQTALFNSASLALIFTFIYFPVNGAVAPANPNQNDCSPITLEEWMSGQFGARGFSGQWHQNDGKLIRISTATGLSHYNVETNTTTEFVINKEIEDKLGTRFSNLIFSSDMKFALVEHGRSSVWRYSALARYDIYDMEKKTLTKLVPPGSESDPEQKQLQLVKWAPTGTGIAFVSDYNIFYKENAENATAVRRLTTDGSEATGVYNGIADWVYEEEMFGGPTALWINEDSTSIAFVQFDNKKVETFQWPVYGEPGDNKTVYPEYRNIRYPKAGFDNPDAKVFTMLLNDTRATPVQLEFPDTASTDLELIGRVVWATDKTLMVTTLNRVQTNSQWHICSMETHNCKIIHTYGFAEGKGWVDMNTPTVSKSGTEFLLTQAVKQEGINETDPNQSYYHIVMLHADGSKATVLTKGKLSVASILGWDETNHKIYFSGTMLNETVVDPSETQVYSVTDNVTNPVMSCLTCKLQNKAGSLCRANSVTFSADYKYYIHRCNGPDIPETTTRNTEGGETIDNPGPTFVDNAELRTNLAKKLVPTTKDYAVPVTDGFTARARLYFPADYDASKKYPLLISVYGGPGSQNIGQGWGLSWEMSMVSNRGIIFGYIDGRGTASQSTEHMFTLHRKLGTAEMEDQIAVAKYLIENVPAIDGNNTSIWGWSYGGYATGKVLELDTEQVFKCGISVAPVTSWRYYDTIYTERYMGLPTEKDNLAGYENGDLISKEHVQNLKTKTYMLVHGNADDNVHYQNSMLLTRAMEQNDVFFHTLSYPDENHGIGGAGMRLHLYHSLERFLFDECYKQEKNDDSSDDESPNSKGAQSASASFIVFLVFPLMKLIFSKLM